MRYYQLWVVTVQAYPRQTSMQITDCDCVHVAIGMHSQEWVFWYYQKYIGDVIVLQNMTWCCHLPELHPQTRNMQLDSARLLSKTHCTPPQRRFWMRVGQCTVKAVLNKKALPVIKKAIKATVILVEKRSAPGPGTPPARRLFLGTRRAVLWCVWMETRKSGIKLKLLASTTASTCCRGLVSHLLLHTPPAPETSLDLLPHGR